MNCFLFDIGNVLADHDHGVVDAAVAKTTTLPAEQSRVQTPDLDNLVESGRISDEDYVERLNRLRGVEWTVADLTDVWTRAFSLNPVGREIFGNAIEAGLGVYTLSNIAGFHVNAIERNWPDFFDGAAGLFLSYRIGFCKPHPHIYQHVLDTLGVSGEECFFIDDRLENIEAARRVGIHACHFIPGNYPAVRQAAKRMMGG